MITMYEVMKHIHNFFTKPDKIVEGKWKIENGALSLPFLREGQYYLIEGSDFNDNKVHQYDDEYDGLTDEEFTGYVIPLYVPAEFTETCTRIGEYMTKHKNDDGYTSESFGGYSYSKGTHADGTPISWADVFKQELSVWRKI